MQVSGNQSVTRPLSNQQNQTKEGIDPKMETKVNAQGQTLYHIKGTNGQMVWSLMPYAAKGNGTPVNPGDVPGPAREGVAGMHNGLFVNEHGLPNAAQRVPADWVPPSWVPEVPAGQISLWNNDYHSLAGSTEPGRYGPGMIVQTNGVAGTPGWAKTERYREGGFTRIIKDPETGYMYLSGPPTDSDGYIFRPNHITDAFQEGTYKKDGSDFPFADYPWVDDGSPDFLERFRAWQKANPGQGLDGKDFRPDSTKRMQPKHISSTKKQDDTVKKAEEKSDPLASIGGLSGSGENLQMLITALLAAVLMNRSGSQPQASPFPGGLNGGYGGLDSLNIASRSLLMGPSGGINFFG